MHYYSWTLYENIKSVFGLKYVKYLGISLEVNTEMFKRS